MGKLWDIDIKSITVSLMNLTLCTALFWRDTYLPLSVGKVTNQHSNWPLDRSTSDTHEWAEYFWHWWSVASAFPQFFPLPASQDTKLATRSRSSHRLDGHDYFLHNRNATPSKYCGTVCGALMLSRGGAQICGNQGLNRDDGVKCGCVWFGHDKHLQFSDCPALRLPEPLWSL